MLFRSCWSNREKNFSSLGFKWNAIVIDLLNEKIRISLYQNLHNYFRVFTRLYFELYHMACYYSITIRHFFSLILQSLHYQNAVIGDDDKWNIPSFINRSLPQAILGARPAAFIHNTEKIRCAGSGFLRPILSQPWDYKSTYCRSFLT